VIIVAGHLRVDANDRDRYVDGCRDVIIAARAAAGCLDFHLSPDPLDEERINVFERWTDQASVERFRGDGPSDDQQSMIVAAQVSHYDISAVTPLT